jgi:hypothetical protein
MAASEDKINSSKPWRSYLITYSQGDLQKFPTRESFGAAVSAVFTLEQSRFKPQHWACCLEQHSDDAGFNYHLALKLTGQKKWLQSKRDLQRKYGIVIFSDHDGYYTAYRYISKFYENIHHSADQANLNKVGSARTKNCQRAYRQRRANSGTATSALDKGDHVGSPPRKKVQEALQHGCI